MTQDQEVPEQDPVDVGTVDDTDPVELEEVPDNPDDPEGHPHAEDDEPVDDEGVEITEGPDA